MVPQGVSGCSRLAIGHGQAVTTLALDLGDASPTAFTNMFKQALGVPPNVIAVQPARPDLRERPR